MDEVYEIIRQGKSGRYTIHGPDRVEVPSLIRQSSNEPYLAMNLTLLELAQAIRDIYRTNTAKASRDWFKRLEGVKFCSKKRDNTLLAILTFCELILEQHEKLADLDINNLRLQRRINGAKRKLEGYD